MLDQQQLGGYSFNTTTTLFTLHTNEIISHHKKSPDQRPRHYLPEMTGTINELLTMTTNHSVQQIIMQISIRKDKKRRLSSGNPTLFIKTPGKKKECPRKGCFGVIKWTTVVDIVQP